MNRVCATFPARSGIGRAWLLLGLIRLYQMTFAKTLPPDTCRFYPSCSHYGYQAVYKYRCVEGWGQGGLAGAALQPV